jgi:hypothetical protein
MLQRPIRCRRVALHTGVRTNGRELIGGDGRGDSSRADLARAAGHIRDGTVSGG